MTPPTATPIVPLRGDARVDFRWRLNGMGFNAADPLAIEDGGRGVQAWHDTATHAWSGDYHDWDNQRRVGGYLIFRGGTPNGRAVRCTTALIPAERAAQAVTFALPLHVNLGSAPEFHVALRVIGQTEETIVLPLRAERRLEVSGGMFKAFFHTLRVDEPADEQPSLRFNGMLHLRVYPMLLNAGGRLVLEFSANTRHMDLESTLVVGSIWESLAATDVHAAWERSGLTEARLAAAREGHRQRLARWVARATDLSSRLAETGRIEVSASAPARAWDRGELRVQAYTGNPAKDVLTGKPNHHCRHMAESVVAALGRRFSLFRYQQWQPVTLPERPGEINPAGLAMMEQWLAAAEDTAEEVMLAFFNEVFIAAYKRATQRGQLPLPPEGLAGMTWDDLRVGQLTALREALRICPRLRVVQMQYEFDNIADTEPHRDAHYAWFKTIYQCVHELNAALPADRQLKVAGLGINTPNNRWNFIEGFLARYAADPDPRKRLDYLTWHTYLFPGSTPAIVRGCRAKLDTLLVKHGLSAGLPVIVDEMGLAEPSTIEDLSGLDGAARKEAAMACFTAALHHAYLAESERFIPISGAGWHFGCLTFGRQSALSPYAKGLLLRARLADGLLPSAAEPRDPDTDYGLHAVATRDARSLRILAWTVSPTIFLADALPLRFPAAELVVRDLPEFLRAGPVRVTVSTMDPEQEPARTILAQPKCQTLPITRGSTERYTIDFTAEEVAALNAIPEQVHEATPRNGELHLSLALGEHCMALVVLEPAD